MQRKQRKYLQFQYCKNAGIDECGSLKNTQSTILVCNIKTRGNISSLLPRPDHS